MSDGDIPLPPCYQIDQYRIHSVLGRGGFGYTYLAEDCDRATMVAIKEHFPQQLAKRLPDGALTQTDDKKRALFEQTLDYFRQEIRLLLRFPHPNLPYIHRVFDGLGTSYFSMDFEQGETLEKWSRSTSRSRLEQELLSIAYQIGDALALLHRNNIFHRDIKPDNIIVRHDGSPVLLDFGIATDAMSTAAHGPAKKPKFISVGYSPIEQYGHGQTGGWSDIYALSATLYKIMSKRRAVAADIRAKNSWNGRPDPQPKLVSLTGGVFSDEFAMAVDRGLALDRTERPRNMKEWLDLLPRRPQFIPGRAPAYEKTHLLPRLSVAGLFNRQKAPRASSGHSILKDNMIGLVIGSLVIVFLTILVMAILSH